MLCVLFWYEINRRPYKAYAQEFLCNSPIRILRIKTSDFYGNTWETSMYNNTSADVGVTFNI